MMRCTAGHLLLVSLGLAGFSTARCHPSNGRNSTGSSHFRPSLSQQQRTFQTDVPVSPTDVAFYFYNRQRRADPIEINLGEFTGHVSDDHNASLKHYFLSHGTSNSYRSWLRVKDALLDRADVNVVLIDWSRHAALFYTAIVAAVPNLAAVMGAAVDRLLRTHGVAVDDVILVGYSLGAHIAGALGAHLKGEADHIIGLDPAGPLFQHADASKRLDATDARFVQVLHTNGGWQGMTRAAGHADFYPNGGGVSQPGCAHDWLGTCAHARAPAYFRESLRTGGFAGRRCTSYADYKRGACAKNQTSYFGEVNVDKAARGRYYFDTNFAPPYATGKC